MINLGIQKFPVIDSREIRVQDLKKPQNSVFGNISLKACLNMKSSISLFFKCSIILLVVYIDLEDTWFFNLL